MSAIPSRIERLISIDFAQHNPEAVALLSLNSNGFDA